MLEKLKQARRKGRIAEIDHLLKNVVPNLSGFGTTLRPILERRKAELQR